ncbi:MAG: glycosyltransferase [Holosporaceae bacterium]|nr:glycosyltransferase [Holosporaceae bacterium]
MKKRKIKVSVIVPVYNVGRFLRRCLDSLINQTMQDIEIICVDDGSRDNSPEILEEYREKDKRILIITQENSSLGAARNSGMDVASGEYIGFVDGDDEVDLNYFEKLYSIAKKYDADIACCGFVRRYLHSTKSRNKLKITAEAVFESKNDKFRVTDTPNLCQVFNKIYRASELQRLQLRFQTGVYYEDVYFSMRALLFMKRLAVTPHTNYRYWVNETSITRSPWTDWKQQCQLKAREDFIALAHEHYVTRDVKYFMKYKKLYSILGFPLMKVHVWETVRKYFLFGVIEVWEIRKRL